tara:strand:+ start:314 stop:1168 length:855 start_codon:yes stop_codon:yes gene_type:complete
VILAVLLIVVLTGDLFSAQSQNRIGGSVIIPNVLLAVFRTIAAGLSLFTVVSICLDRDGGPSIPLFYESRKCEEVVLYGVHRLAAFTVWSFIAFGAYFALAAFASWSEVFGASVPSWILAVIPPIFAIACGTALLVTVVVTYYLIPNNQKKGFDVAKYFLWYEIVMHNLNVILLGVDLVLGGIDINLSMVAFPVMFGIVYVYFAYIYAVYGGGIYLYDFLDPRIRLAPFIHIGLFVMIALFYSVALVLDALVDWNIIAGGLGVAVCVYSIVRFREPVRAGFQGP